MTEGDLGLPGDGLLELSEDEGLVKLKGDTIDEWRESVIELGVAVVEAFNDEQSLD